MGRRRTPERDLQVAVAQLLDSLRATGLRWYHVPNELASSGRTGAIRGRRAKDEGVKAGVPDCIIPSHMCVIELKSSKGRLSPAQREWLDDYAGWGWTAAVCRSMDEVIEILRSIGALGR